MKKLSIIMCGIFTILSVSTFSSFSQSNKIGVYASGKAETDLIVASSMANSMNARLYTTKGYSRNVLTEKDQIETLYVVGGPDSVPEEELKQLPVKKIVRVSGKDRYQTSIAAYKLLEGKTKEGKRVNIVSGIKLEDSVSASTSGVPTILLDIRSKDNIKEVSNLLAGKELVVVGGPMSVPDDLLAQLKAKRISGRDRYETSKAFYDEYNKDRTLAISADSRIRPTVMKANEEYLKGNGLVLKEFNLYLNGQKGYFPVYQCEKYYKKFSEDFKRIDSMKKREPSKLKMDLMIKIDGRRYEFLMRSIMDTKNPVDKEIAVRIDGKKEVVLDKNDTLTESISQSFREIYMESTK